MQQWTVADVAEHLGVAASTVRSWRARGQMPDADGRIGATPWWHPETITIWNNNRPGKGRWREQDPTMTTLNSVHTQTLEELDAWGASKCVTVSWMSQDMTHVDGARSSSRDPRMRLIAFGPDDPPINLFRDKTTGRVEWSTRVAVFTGDTREVAEARQVESEGDLEAGTFFISRDDT